MVPGGFIVAFVSRNFVSATPAADPAVPVGAAGDRWMHPDTMTALEPAAALGPGWGS
jgi:hypothetical protein